MVPLRQLFRRHPHYRYRPGVRRRLILQALGERLRHLTRRPRALGKRLVLGLMAAAMAFPLFVFGLALGHFHAGIVGESSARGQLLLATLKLRIEGAPIPAGARTAEGCEPLGITGYHCRLQVSIPPALPLAVTPVEGTAADRLAQRYAVAASRGWSDWRQFEVVLPRPLAELAPPRLAIITSRSSRSSSTSFALDWGTDVLAERWLVHLANFHLDLALTALVTLGLWLSGVTLVTVALLRPVWLRRLAAAMFPAKKRSGAKR